MDKELIQTMTNKELLEIIEIARLLKLPCPYTLCWSCKTNGVPKVRVMPCLECQKEYRIQHRKEIKEQNG